MSFLRFCIIFICLIAQTLRGGIKLICTKASFKYCRLHPGAPAFNNALILSKSPAKMNLNSTNSWLHSAWNLKPSLWDFGGFSQKVLTMFMFLLHYKRLSLGCVSQCINTRVPSISWRTFLITFGSCISMHWTLIGCQDAYIGRSCGTNVLKLVN